MATAKAKAVDVVREGDKIILPEGMSYDDACTWIMRQKESEEKTVAIADFMECFPMDGMVALARAFKEKFGFTAVADRDGFWGPQPPVMIQVPLANGEFETAILGKLQPPKWEGGHLVSQFTEGCKLNITGMVKRKFEKEVKDIIKLTREILREQSIYRGQAITVDLHWFDNPEEFDIQRDQPKFFPATGAELILNRSTEFELATSVYMILERGSACRSNGINLKHGALFKGPFGTGKTLTAKVIAQKSVANGWTFIYLHSASQLANGLRFAKMYAPAVVFAEDVDAVVRHRDENMNDLLNVLDGVDTKDNPIMVILTTNNAEDIDPSFLRAGRIDTVIHFGEPDAEAAVRFIKHFGGRMLKEGEDLNPVGLAVAGLVPAFVGEVISKAKRFAIYRTGNDEIVNEVTADDLLQAADAVKEHRKMLQPKEATPEERLANYVRQVHRYGAEGELLADNSEK